MIGETRSRLMTVWYRNLFTSVRSCPCARSRSSEVLCPYLAAKYIPPAIITAATSSAPGRESATGRSEDGCLRSPRMSGAPTAAATGESRSSSGVTLAL